MEFVFRPAAQEIFDHFCSIWGVRIALFKPNGERILFGKTGAECTYCRLLRADLGYEDKCLALDRTKQEEAAKSNGTVLYTCHGGMTDAIIPLSDDGRLLGFVSAGQFRTLESVLPEAVRTEWENRYGDSALVEAFDQAPRIRSEHVEHVLALLSILVRFIVSQHMIEIRQEDAIQPILLYMEQNIERNVTLAEVAAVAHRSPSTLSHVFRRVLGQNFKRVQINMKLDRAEQLLRTNPQMTVREVAYRLGYQDPLYFSRLFKKYRHAAPSSCRLRLP